MNKRYALIVSVIAVSAILAAYVYNYYSAPAVQIASEEFAKCLGEKNATMYGAVWCHFCQNQKEMFGEYFKYINYVECPDNVDLCQAAGVRAYPTWSINGRLYEGLQSFESLSNASGCSLSQ